MERGRGGEREGRTEEDDMEWLTLPRTCSCDWLHLLLRMYLIAVSPADDAVYGGG